MKEYSRAFERRYSIKSNSCLTLPLNTIKTAKFNLAKNLNKFYLSHSTLISKKINPWFITGFTDAEGSFIIKVQHNENLSTK